MQFLALISFISAILGSTFDLGISVELFSNATGFLALPFSCRGRLIFGILLQSLPLLFRLT